MGYANYDMSEYWQLTHEQSYSDDEFFDFVDKALYECMKVYIKEGEHISHKDPKLIREYNHLSNLFSLYNKEDKERWTLAFLDEMEKFGFERLEFQSRFDIDGSCDLNPNKKDHHYSEHNSATKLIKRFFGRYDSDWFGERKVE